MTHLAFASLAPLGVATRLAACRRRLRGWIIGLTASTARPEGRSEPVSASRAMDLTSSVVVAFPTADRRRLLDLARDLEQRFVALGLADHAPFHLRVDPGPVPRLTIDDTAYVEVLKPFAGYRVVLEDAFESRITLETRDFDSIANFVRHYIVARLTPDLREGDAA